MKGREIYYKIYIDLLFSYYYHLAIITLFSEDSGDGEKLP